MPKELNSMLKFSANLTMMFAETKDPIERIKIAKRTGFNAVEFIFIYDMEIDKLVEATEKNEVDWSVINIAVGEGVKMGPLVAAAPGKEKAFRENLTVAKHYCTALKPSALVVPAYTPPEEISKDQRAGKQASSAWRPGFV